MQRILFLFQFWCTNPKGAQPAKASIAACKKQLAMQRMLQHSVRHEGERSIGHRRGCNEGVSHGYTNGSCSLGSVRGGGREGEREREKYLAKGRSSLVSACRQPGGESGTRERHTAAQERPGD